MGADMTGVEPRASVRSVAARQQWRTFIASVCSIAARRGQTCMCMTGGWETKASGRYLQGQAPPSMGGIGGPSS